MNPFAVNLPPPDARLINPLERFRRSSRAVRFDRAHQCPCCGRPDDRHRNLRRRSPCARYRRAGSGSTPLSDGAASNLSGPMTHSHPTRRETARAPLVASMTAARGDGSRFPIVHLCHCTLLSAGLEHRPENASAVRFQNDGGDARTARGGRPRRRRGDRHCRQRHRGGLPPRVPAGTGHRPKLCKNGHVWDSLTPGSPILAS